MTWIKEHAAWLHEKLAEFWQLLHNPKSMRKFFAALVGILGQIVAANVLEGTALMYAQVILAIVAGAGVYAVPNLQPPGA